MDLLDYREQLGIGFNDSEKQELFMTKKQVFLQAHNDYPFSRKQEIAFCYIIGEECYSDNETVLNINWKKSDPEGLQKAWTYFESKKGDFNNFLVTIVAFANAYNEDIDVKDDIYSAIKQALTESHIPYDIVTDNDGLFFFPKGAAELDKSLVSEPLQWLSDYPKARSTYCRALKQYANGEHTRDVADNFRKALEEFLQEYLGNPKNLESNKNEICRNLGSKGVDAEFIGMMQPLLNTYKNINDKYAKHNDALDERLLEFIMYQTGVFIRMLISVK